MALIYNEKLIDLGPLGLLALTFDTMICEARTFRAWSDCVPVYE